MIDILVEISCKFEMYIFKIAQVINKKLSIAFLYVLSIALKVVILQSGHEIALQMIKGK